MLRHVGLVILLLGGPGCQAGEPPAPQPADSGATGRSTSSPATFEGAPTTADDGIPRWPVIVGGVRAQVRVARTRAQHFSGLSGVKLRKNEGMLFMYGPKRVRGFWMKGCIMGLDIAWLTDDLKVMQIDTLGAPGPETTDATMPRASSPREVKFVLEMPAGWFDRHGVKAGAEVLVPTSLLRLKAE